jgi:hypothetical protein
MERVRLTTAAHELMRARRCILVSGTSGYRGAAEERRIEVRAQPEGVAVEAGRSWCPPARSAYRAGRARDSRHSDRTSMPCEEKACAP